MVKVMRKEIRLGIKRGWTIEDFCKKYGCTEVEFTEKIGKIYGLDSESTLSEIKKNEKKKRKVKVKEVVQPEQISDSTEKRSQPDETVDELQELQEAEVAQSREVMRLESEHKKYAQQHRECLKELIQIDVELGDIKNAFERKSLEYREIVRRNNGFVAKMNEISELRHEKVVALDEIRAKIAEFETVVLLCDEEGQFELFECARQFEFDDSGYETLYADMITQEEYQDLRVKDIRSLAKATRIMINSNSKLEILFDNPELEPVFASLVAGFVS